MYSDLCSSSIHPFTASPCHASTSCFARGKSFGSLLTVLVILFQGYEYTGWDSLLSGWGRTSYHPLAGGPVSEKLLQISLPVVSDKSCLANCLFLVKFIFQLGLQFCHIAPTQMCAGGEQDRGACHGDSGSALVAKDPGEQGWSVVGVTSWSRGCALDGQFTVFTEVSYYLDWIAEQYGLYSPP